MTTVSPVNQRASVPAIRRGEAGWSDDPQPGVWGFYTIENISDRAGILFRCPCGCGSLMSVAFVAAGVRESEPVWSWDGNEEKPTVTPSILVHQLNERGERIGEHWHGFLTAGEFRSC